MAVTFSTIIVTYNQQRELGKILESIEFQGFKDLEVIIADDGSLVDNLKEIRKNWSFPIKYIWHPDTCWWLSKCRNMAAKIAEGKYLHIIDGDTLVGEYTYTPYLKYLNKYKLLWGLRHIINPKILRKKINQDNLDRYTVAGDFRKEAAIRLFSGSNFVVSREKYLEIQWNEEFKYYGFDDYEFALRWVDAGLKGEAVISSIAYHLNHSAKLGHPKAKTILEETEKRIGRKNEIKSN